MRYILAFLVFFFMWVFFGLLIQDYVEDKTVAMVLMGFVAVVSTHIQAAIIRCEL